MHWNQVASKLQFFISVKYAFSISWWRHLFGYCATLVQFWRISFWQKNCTGHIFHLPHSERQLVHALWFVWFLKLTDTNYVTQCRRTCSNFYRDCTCPLRVNMGDPPFKKNEHKPQHSKWTSALINLSHADIGFFYDRGESLSALTNSGDHCTREEEWLSEAPRWDAGAVLEDGHAAVVGVDDSAHEVLEGVVWKGRENSVNFISVRGQFWLEILKDNVAEFVPWKTLHTQFDEAVGWLYTYFLTHLKYYVCLIFTLPYSIYR